MTSNLEYLEQNVLGKRQGPGKRTNNQFFQTRTMDHRMHFFVKHREVNGYDDIDFLLSLRKEIEAFEERSRV